MALITIPLIGSLRISEFELVGGIFEQRGDEGSINLIRVVIYSCLEDV